MKTKIMKSKYPKYFVDEDNTFLIIYSSRQIKFIEITVTNGLNIKVVEDIVNPSKTTLQKKEWREIPLEEAVLIPELDGEL